MTRILDSKAALDRYFLETRCKLIEIAANLDRIAEATGADVTQSDRRMDQIKKAIDVLSSDEVEKAAKCQLVFSLSYEDGWKAPNR